MSRKKKEPDLPDDWGIMEAVCADSQHRFLPDAPKCGCGKTANPEVERAYLERDVVEAARYWDRRQGEYSHPTEVDATILTVVRAWNGLRKAVAALEEFESAHSKARS